METKPLLYGIIGFLLGGLVVSIAASQTDTKAPHTAGSDMTMTQMVDGLKDKRGDAYDRAFISGMIEHHRGAVEMAELSAERSKHPEIKQLSEAILSAQRTEIAQMQQWQADWGYGNAPAGHAPMDH